ncbi:hypothetical protein [Maribacter ulvicola]|uniref:Uncharacterized protein n=1 Tax=Maribacter ulvicola TaxID=228959 RepID=A0A1N6ZDE9_9FLAO|nr:hypothetical protein [Maribacter ulvicola]SIR24942.1 hypothetical protein SAMN05421797_108146 [Maribacter ulvicola]
MKRFKITSLFAIMIFGVIVGKAQTTKTSLNFNNGAMAKVILHKYLTALENTNAVCLYKTLDKKRTIYTAKKELVPIKTSQQIAYWTYGLASFKHSTYTPHSINYSTEQ